MVCAPDAVAEIVCAGGAELVVDATQNVKAVGLSVTVWAIAVSRQHNAIPSTKGIQVMDLMQVFTNFSPQ